MELEGLLTVDEHQSGAKCHLVDKKGLPVDAFVIVCGEDSANYRMAKRSQRRAIIELQQKKINFDDYDFFELDVEFVSSVVTDWGDITANGEPVEFTKEAAVSLFSNSPQNVEKVLAFCGDRENFIKG